MARRKRAKVPVKAGKQKDSPDKTKKVPVQDNMSEEDDETATPDKEKRSDSVEGIYAGGGSSPKKRFKRNLRRVVDHEDEDWIPESEGSDCSSASDRDVKNSEEDMNISDVEELSSQENKEGDNSKRKMHQSKRFKEEIDQDDAYSLSRSENCNSSRVNKADKDEDDFAVIPNSNEGSSESLEKEKLEPKPRQQLRGALYIKIRNNTWRIILVKGNGNCLFYTIAKLDGKEPAYHYQMRVNIVFAAVNEYWEDVKLDVKIKHFSSPEFDNKSDDELKKLYYNKMTRDGEYASDIEIKVASKMLPFSISYIQKYANPQGKQKPYRVCNYDSNSIRSRKWILFTGGNEQGHYEPLEQVGTIKPLENGMYDDENMISEKQLSKHQNPDLQSSSQKQEAVNIHLHCIAEQELEVQERNATQNPNKKKNCPKKQQQHINTTSNSTGIKTKKKHASTATCSFCGHTSAKKSAIATHQICHLDVGQKFKCEYCECFTGFGQAGGLAMHMTKVHPNEAAAWKQKLKERMFPCHQCEKSYPRKDQLQDHQRRHLDEKLFECSVCQKRFNTRNNLNTHLKCHSKLKTFLCDECGESFVRKSSLAQHKKVHSNNWPFECETCGKSFRTNGNLKEHEEVHTNDRPFKCKYCTDSFKSKASLKKHYICHSDLRKFKCDKCDKTFKRSRELAKHKTTHSEEKPHVCEKCGKRFRRTDALKQHAAIHSEERPFRCEICEMTFKVLPHLIGHMKCHTNNLPYNCDTCGKCFKRKHSLSVHVRSRHNEDRPYRCEECAKRFKTEKDLKQHFISHSDNRPHQCGKCGRRFKKLVVLKGHMYYRHENPNARPFTCSKCSATFRRKSALVRHQKSPCSPTYRCNICENVSFDKNSNLAVHLKAHANQRNFICKTCGVSYVTQHYLDLHTKKVHEKRSNLGYRFPCYYCSVRCSRSDLREFHIYRQHFKEYCEAQFSVPPNIVVIGQGKLKYVLYSILMVKAEDFPNETGDEIWDKLCDNDRIEVQFYVGIHSSLQNVVVRSGHTQPSAMKNSAVYQEHRNGWRCFWYAKQVANYVEMRRQEALIIKWAKSRDSKYQTCINKKLELFATEEECHIETLHESELEYFNFDSTPSPFSVVVGETGVELGLRLKGRLQEMRFNGCDCSTCLRHQPRITDIFGNVVNDDGKHENVEDKEEDDEENDDVGVIYAEPLMPEIESDSDESDDDESGSDDDESGEDE